VAAGVVGFQVLPAVTWLPPVRRLIPGLASPMPRGTVAVTFDDGPHPEGTVAILDRLDELDWPATFFMLGSAAQRHPAVAREVVARGHSVGVHGFDHRYLLARSLRDASSDLGRARDAVSSATGVDVKWWRPPYGVLSATGLAAASRLGLRPLLWSAWGKDWVAGATPASIAATVMAGRVDGGVALLHDSDVTSAAGSWRATERALELLARRVAANGIRIARLPAA